jgi:hypothetical protein
MKLALITATALAFAAPAFAQYATPAPQNPPIATTPTAGEQTPVQTPVQAGDTTLSTTGHSRYVYHGPHAYPLHSRGGPGDPRIIDHSDDTLVVEPTHSSATIVVSNY